MAQVKKRHHSVPQFYLGRFTGPDGLLWIYPVDGSEPKHVGPRNAAVERYLYAPEVGEEPHDDTVEDVLAEMVDGPAVAATDRLIRGDQLRPEDRAAIAFYVAVQELRVPAIRDQHGANLEHLFYMTTDILVGHPEHVMEKAEEMGLPPQQVLAGLQAIKDGRFQLRATKVSWLQTLFEVVRGTAPLIAKLPWLVVEAPSGFEFLTSDSPIVRVLTDRSVPNLCASGWLSPSAETTLVLDPEHVLVIAPEGREGRQLGRPGWCEDVNRRTLEQAYRYVFSRNQADWIARAIHQRVHCRKTHACTGQPASPSAR